jgi:hypothetical protein
LLYRIANSFFAGYPAFVDVLLLRSFVSSGVTPSSFLYIFFFIIIKNTQDTEKVARQRFATFFFFFIHKKKLSEKQSVKKKQQNVVKVWRSKEVLGMDDIIRKDMINTRKSRDSLVCRYPIEMDEIFFLGGSLVSFIFPCSFLSKYFSNNKLVG